MTKKLIFIQLNEINIDLIKKYALKKKFKFFTNDVLNKTITTKSENDYKNIEPWIQWVSVNTGKTANEHKVFRLGDIVNSKDKQIYEKIEEMGFKVGAICPMNTLNNLDKPKYFISDPWTKNKQSTSYFETKLTNAICQIVNNNSNKKFLFKSYFIFFIALLTILNQKNFSLYIKLLLLSLKKKWYKALILDRFLHDYHLKCLKKFNPDFSTIFFNSGAHIQHHYLLYSKVIDKKISLPSWYMDKNYDPIEEMINFYDETLHEYNSFNNFEIIIATGLTQVPYDRMKYYYRPVDHKNFLKNFHIEAKNIFPRMTRDFLVEFLNNEEKENAKIIFEKINKLNNNQVFELDDRNKSLFITFKFDEELDDNSFLINHKHEKIFLKEKISFVALKNGMHDQKGFILTCKNFPNDLLNNFDHVKSIHDVIIKYFKYEKKNR